MKILTTILLFFALVTPTFASGGYKISDWSLSFDGENDYINVGDPADGSLDITGSITISATIYPTRVSVGGQHGIAVKGIVTSNGYSLLFDGNGYAANLAITGKHRTTNSVNSGTNSIELNKWQRGAFVLDTDAQISRAFIDGVVKGVNLTATSLGVANATPFEIGRRFLSSSALSFPGNISDVRIWDRALSVDEISKLHNSNIVPRDNLVSEWSMNEAVGTTANDTAGSNDGTIIGAVYTSDTYKNSLRTRVLSRY